MLAEECGLNPYLEQQGIEVLESERVANENPMGPSILDELIGGNNRS